MPSIMKALTVLSVALAISASPCPYGDLAERGLLSEQEADNFYAARAEGESAVDAQIKARELERKAEHESQATFYKRQLDLGHLLLGGGLLNGVLQPFTGVLSALDVPTPQVFSLKKIPGDDAAHQYEAPKKTDVRGMCPTLNTMANHGYIARNGITTFAEAANACQITLGFGYDSCIFLSALGLLAGGDIPTGAYSIGGMDDRVPNTLGPSLGISRHEAFEIDNSISRADAQTGNQADFNLPRWNRLVDIANKHDGQFGMDTFAEERVIVYNEAKDTNPNFNAGVRWLAVSLAERVFIPRALPNGTDEMNANYDNVAPFFLNETFPDDWFRRGSAYSLVNVGTDIAALLLSSPELTIPGQNQGLNNFVPLGLDIGATTPTSAVCFLAAAIFEETPGFITPALINAYSVVQGFLNGAVAPLFHPYNCKVVETANPGKSAGLAATVAGPSAECNVLVNGKYQC